MADGTTVHEGLDGVVVTKTMLSRVDGEAGRLIIGGLDVEQLAEHGRSSRLPRACSS